MKLKILLALPFLLYTLSISGQKSFIYSSDGKKLFLNRLDSTIIIKFIDGVSFRNREKLVSSSSLKEIDQKSLNDSITLYKLYKITDVEKISEIQRSEVVEYADFALVCDDGIIEAPTNQILIKFKADMTLTNINFVKDTYFIDMIEKSKFDNSVFIATLKKDSKLNSIEVSGLLYEGGKVEYAEPNFVRFLKPHTSDSYFLLQWSLNNYGQFGGTSNADINALDVWNITKGSSCIRIAVLDEGVDLTHPDLQANLLTGFDETGNDSNGGCRGNEAHGTNVAGIISALENTIGIVGVAPLCRIIPIRIAIEDAIGNWITTDAQIASGFAHAWDEADADIISCSWGGGNPSITITNAINAATTNGRSNKGCVVVFSAGNENHNVTYPASLENVIAVGATSMCDTRKRSSNNQSECNPGVYADPLGVSCDGEKWWGSNYGTNLDVVAPGVHNYSTDIQSSNGYNDTDGTSGNYYEFFNGTSSACPHVSAILALILSVNSNLTQAQARQILESNTDKIGNYSFTNVAGQPNGTWNNEVGYGRVNAFNAVNAAINGGYISGGNTLICESPNVTFHFNNRASGIPIYWIKSENLDYVSGQNTDDYSVKAKSGYSGNGWVKATLNSACDGVTSYFWVGAPSVEVSGPSSGSVGNSYTYYENPANLSNPTYFEWTLSPPYDGNNIYNYGYWANAAFYADQEGYFQIGCTPQNTCGTGTMATAYVGIYNYESLFSISPNPASNEITITKKKIDNPQTIPGQNLSNYDNTKYEIRIIDLYGGQHITTTRSGSEFTIPISKLKDGNYVVQLNNGKTTFNLKLIIKH